ncbi:putative efflux pump antibiotic resistance [Phaeomoniella chlamydospora]|uniref:Putative efflux pump antibiotic resistance n=1 Tax=Phaeomoniella chlamydospora TaxID=158046 RepID=A0A0G2DZ00_PHACM|nr:putative efflux pump antibiotic resistance [Phaeomoniella chlamydospora]
MAEQERVAMDNITALEPATAGASLPAEHSPVEHTREPLDLLETPKVRTKLRLYAILLALYLVLFIAALDQTIVATSIPTISAALHSASGYVWIGGAYLLANAASCPIWAKCSDIWGPVSTSMQTLIAARALQGTAGGGLGQLVTITISDLFSEGLLAVDWFGTLSILAVTLLLLLGLDFGGAIFPWTSPKVICLVVFGTLMIGFFLFSEQHLAKYPLMPLSMFKSWSNNATFLVAFAHSMVSIGVEYYLPLYFQSVKQASPFRSGILILPMMVTEAAVDIIVGILIHQTSRYREITWAGATLMTLGTGLYINFRTNTPVARIVGFEIIGGIGTALLFQAPMIAIQNTVSQANTASATATLGFFRSLATSLSLVLGGVVFQNSMDARQSSLAATGLSESILEALSGDQAAANVEIVKSIQNARQRHVVLDAFAWSLRNMFIMYTCVAAVAMVASAFVKHQRLCKEHTETKTGIQHLTERVA